MKRIFLLVLVIASLTFASGYRCVSVKPRSTDSVSTKLKIAKDNTDEYYRSHSDDMIELVRVSGVDTLLEIKDTLFQKKYNKNKMPDKYECSYDILKDNTGKIIYIDRISSSENPYSLHIYTHYFDHQGRTYAFEKKEAMYFGGVKPKLVLDNHVMYYSKDFRVINQSDTVTDINHQVVKLTQEEHDRIGLKHDIYRNLASCLKGYGINLKK